MRREQRSSKQQRLSDPPDKKNAEFGPSGNPFYSSLSPFQHSADNNHPIVRHVLTRARSTSLGRWSPLKLRQGELYSNRAGHIHQSHHSSNIVDIFFNHPLQVAGINTPHKENAHRLLLLQLPPGTQCLVRVEPHDVIQQGQGYHAARQEVCRGRRLFFSGRRRAWVARRRAVAAAEDLLCPAQKKAPQLTRERRGEGEGRWGKVT